MSATQTAEHNTAIQAPTRKTTNGKSHGTLERRRGKPRAVTAAPAAGDASAAPAVAKPVPIRPAMAARSTSGLAEHPLINGLVQMLPAAGTGTLAEAKAWMDLAAAALAVICKFPGTLTITALPAAA